jgi:Kef-type K+ transport system membrane component KefB
VLNDLTLPIPLAATPSADALADLLILLIAAKLGEEIMKRLRQPGIIGEILGGLLVGPSLLGWVEPSDIIDVFAELGVVFLLFWVGLESRLSDMRRVGRVSAIVGGAGFVLPLAAGIGVGAAIGESVETSLFVGAALVATSVAITSAVLAEARALGTRPARTILGAAIVDDILAMILLAVVTGIATGGGVDVAAVAITIVLALAFVAFFALGGTRVAARWPKILEAPRFSESPLPPAVIVCLGLSVLAAQIGLALIIGAFLAGVIVAETKEHTAIEQEVAPINAFFAPFFFGSIGLLVSFDVFGEWSTIGLLGTIVAVAAATKFVGAWLGARSLGRRESLLVGSGWSRAAKRGSSLRASAARPGVFDDRLFSVVVGMSVLTTLLTPPLLRRLVDAPAPPVPLVTGTAEPETAGGAPSP